LVRSGGTQTAETVDSEVKRAIEWLTQERYEPRRHAAVLVLKELAVNAPTLFNVHVRAVVDVISEPLTDQSQVIRDVAVEALRACLDVIAERDNSWHYRKLYNDAMDVRIFFLFFFVVYRFLGVKKSSKRHSTCNSRISVDYRFVVVEF
jgi:FKBP12-rapamycin complex-associated protein